MNRKLTKEEEMMSYEGYDPILPGPGMLLDEEIPIPKPRPKRPQTVNRAKKADKLPIIAKANGGMIDRAAVRGKTKGKIC